jgi:hypothetical protein
LIYYRCKDGHDIVLNDEWPQSLNRPCPRPVKNKETKREEPCGKDSTLMVLREKK